MEQIKIKDMDGRPMFVPHPYLSKMMVDRDAVSEMACALYTALLAEMEDATEPEDRINFPCLPPPVWQTQEAVLTWLLEHGHISVDERTFSYAEPEAAIEGRLCIVVHDRSNHAGFVSIDMVSGIVGRHR